MKAKKITKEEMAKAIDAEIINEEIEEQTDETSEEKTNEEVITDEEVEEGNWWDRQPWYIKVGIGIACVATGGALAGLIIHKKSHSNEPEDDNDILNDDCMRLEGIEDDEDESHVISDEEENDETEFEEE